MKQYIEQNKDRFLEELFSLIRIPSISSEQEHKPDMVRCAERWKELLLKAQTPQLLETYDVIADSLLENALYFFRDRIENAFASRDYAGYRGGDRLKRGKNDTIYERLDVQFTFEQAMQFSVAMKGATVTHNSVRQMLKNWRKQGLISQTPEGGYRKMS